jgi:hypothetical protein
MLYNRVAWLSMYTLRHFNRDLPVQVIYVMDEGRDNRDIGCSNDFGISAQNSADFIEDFGTRFAAEVTVVQNYDSGEEAGFPPAQRRELVKAVGEDILFLDADTFILDDLHPIFEKAGKNKIVADRNDWMNHNKSMPDNTHPFNSGVVLYGGATIRDYGSKVYDLCVGLKKGTHTDSAWLDSLEHLWRPADPSKPERKGREEAAFCIWVKESKVDFEYFDKSDVQTKKITGQTRIYHTMMQNWYLGYSRFFRGSYGFKPPLRVKRMLV